MKPNFFSILLGNVAIFNPKGFIASEQKELIITVVSIMLIAVVPVLFLTYFFAWKYRASNNAKYSPDLERNKTIQFAWAGLLVTLVVIIATLAWKSSHALDPRKAIMSDKKPITIQVVALEWKWLFIYPEQKIASLNFVQFPEDTPINFEITADAPMNSMWIPQLGGQMYAMNGMKTQLHLMADESGDYRGMSSNISGEGFSGMTFTARATSETDFNAWTETQKFYSEDLTLKKYEEISKPSKNVKPISYELTEPNLFDIIMMKYMSNPEMHHH